MRLHFTLLFFLHLFFVNAQSVVGFEDISLPDESFLNGDDESGGFTSGDVFLPNEYNAQFFSWSGWAISNTTDVETPGFSNQYSAIAGSGANGSKNYAVTYAFGNNNIILQGEAAGKPVSGMYITNNTYAYLSMLEGDAFAKKFGGVTGNDPDFFLLTIRAYHNGNLSTDSVNFYLADYRFQNNSLDYIVDDWRWVNLSSLGAVDSLSFRLSSSDNGQFGMNTPSFFCVDNIFSSDPTSLEIVEAEELINVFPNPATDWVQIVNYQVEPLTLTLLDFSGRVVLQKQINDKSDIINLQNLPKGSFIIQVQNQKFVASQLIVRQ